MRMIAGAILVLAASVVFARYPGQVEAALIVVLSLILALAGILMILPIRFRFPAPFVEKSGAGTQQEERNPHV